MKKVWKWWWAWQDREHEEWLAEQSRQGLHLCSMDSLGLLHRFKRGAPADYVYRWDFRISGGKGDYRQLFRDAGWELVGEVAGSWMCWRKQAGPGTQPEIFTDRASQAAKYRNLLLTIVPGLSLLPMVILDRGLWRDIQTGSQVAVGIFGLSLFSITLTTFAALAIWRRMRQV